MEALIAAAASWKIRPAASVDSFAGHLREIVHAAAARDAALIVLPELAILELLALHPEAAPAEVPQLLAGYEEWYEDLLFGLAHETAALIVGGSHFLNEAVGVANASLAAYPTDDRFKTADGGYLAGDFQRKVNLTTYERDVWNLAPGAGLQALRDQRLGITVCYDCEFPESGRALAEAGVLAQCVPAFTQDLHGFHRVREACRARAIENQVFVLHASLAGSLGREPVPSTSGSSAILAPCVQPFPADGILAETRMDEEEIAVAELDFEAVLTARDSGDVRNWHDRSRGDWTVHEPS